MAVSAREGRESKLCCIVSLTVMELLLFGEPRSPKTKQFSQLGPLAVLLLYQLLNGSGIEGSNHQSEAAAVLELFEAYD